MHIYHYIEFAVNLKQQVKVSKGAEKGSELTWSDLIVWSIMTQYPSVNCIVSAYYFLLQFLLSIQDKILSMETNHQNLTNIPPLFLNSQEKSKFISIVERQDLTFFYAFCKGYLINKQDPNKQKTQDYTSGFFIVINDNSKSKTTFFFLKRSKQGFVVETVNRVEEKEVNVNKITKLSDDGRRLNIYYENGNNIFHIKFDGQDHSKVWKALFYFYRPDLKDPSKIKSEKSRTFNTTMDSSQKLNSTNSSQKRENAENVLPYQNPFNIIKQEEKGSSRISDPGYEEPWAVIEKLEQRQKELNNEVEKLTERLRASQRKVSQLLLDKDEDQKVLNEEIERLKQLIKLHQQQHRKQSQTLKLQNTKIILQLKKYSKELEDQKLKNSTLNEKINYLSSLVSESQNNQKHFLQIQKINMNIQSRQKQMAEECSRKLSKMTKQIQHYIQRARELQDQCEKYYQTIQLYKYSHIFTAQIFQNQPEMKKDLTIEIETFSRRKIARTRLIYKMDPLNKVNFHHYIDGKSNIAVIARTITGFYLAAFSESPIMPKSIATDGGLIVSLSNKKSFKCLPQRRSVVYDDYYIIFGNSQFRIRSQQAKIFSNFGIANCHYANNDCKVDILLGTNQREVELDNYQVYQLLFQ